MYSMVYIYYIVHASLCFSTSRTYWNAAMPDWCSCRGTQAPQQVAGVEGVWWVEGWQVPDDCRWVYSTVPTYGWYGLPVALLKSTVGHVSEHMGVMDGCNQAMIPR